VNPKSFLSDHYERYKMILTASWAGDPTSTFVTVAIGSVVLGGFFTFGVAVPRASGPKL